MQTRTPLVLRAYAKINLDLRIVGELPDGYHEVRTVLQSLRLHDTLTFTSAEGPFAIECNEAAIPTGEQNLIWRAAAIVASLRTGRPIRPFGVRVRLVKRIPAQAGLGGGSADAATTLIALARLWQLDLDLPTLSRLASKLGADVPFFLAGGTALGSGRGDEISPLREPPTTSVVVVKPAFGVSTPDAYRWFDDDGPPRATRRVRSALTEWPEWARDLRNDLEPPVVRRHPAIGRVIRALRMSGAAHVAMSGSGSAVFGLFPDIHRAFATETALARRGWAVFRTHTLSRTAVSRQRERVLGLRSLLEAKAVV